MINLYCKPGYIRLDKEDYLKNQQSVDEALKQSGCKACHNYPFVYIEGNLYEFIYELTIDEYVFAK